ncbi:MAG: transposase [Planctomycetota bacterium]|nr:transposase [Planctomycetota bacterium]
MVKAYHAIFSAYGFWLPNDPRGSWSDFVRQWDLLRFGPATKVNTPASLAHGKHDRQRRLDAKRSLQYPPVIFTGKQAQCVGHGFAIAMEQSGYPILACSIMSDHVHLVIGRCGRRIEQIAGHLKGRATKLLNEKGLHPLTKHIRNGVVPSPWAQGGWNVYLNSEAQIEKAIAYVEMNPVRAGLPRQHWSFVKPYERHMPNDLNISSIS